MSDDVIAKTEIFDIDSSVGNILIVDDERSILDMLSQILKDANYNVDSVETSGEALEKLMDKKYQLIIVDVNLPGISGHELLKFAKKHYPLMDVILITGQPVMDDAVNSIKIGALDYLSKPFSIPKLLSSVEYAINRHQKTLGHKLSTDILGVSDEISEILQDYNVIKLIGAGAMGVVFHVQVNGDDMALKILRNSENPQQHEMMQARFLREAKILSQLHHPNIIEIYKYGIHPKVNLPYILMEYVDGGVLSDKFYQKELSFKEKIKIIEQLALALSMVHSKGILHRDIKPPNILLLKTNDVKLTDFGVARVEDSSLTLTSEVLGSPAYLSPESVTFGKSLDARSDIFSLGIVAYELLVGTRPFHGESVTEIMKVIRKESPKRPSSIVKDLPLEVDELLGGMLAKKVEDRFQKADEVAAFANMLRNEKSTFSFSRIWNHLNSGKRNSTWESNS